MKTFKKILKYIFLFIGIVIFLWLSCGFYLYSNLPDIEIKEKISNILHQIEYTGSIDKNLDIDSVLNTLIPEKRYFHNKERYNTFLPLFAIYFEKYFSSQYKLCFSDFNYEIPLTSKKYNGGDWFSLVGFKYSIIGSHEEITKNYIQLTKYKNFPINVDLVKGKNCNGKILTKFILSLEDSEDNDIYLKLKKQ